jgi:hypothetical protein
MKSLRESILGSTKSGLKNPEVGRQYAIERIAKYFGDYKFAPYLNSEITNKSMKEEIEFLADQGKIKINISTFIISDLEPFAEYAKAPDHHPIVLKNGGTISLTSSDRSNRFSIDEFNSIPWKEILCVEKKLKNIKISDCDFTKIDLDLLPHSVSVNIAYGTYYSNVNEAIEWFKKYKDRKFEITDIVYDRMMQDMLNNRNVKRI